MLCKGRFTAAVGSQYGHKGTFLNGQIQVLKNHYIRSIIYSGVGICKVFYLNCLFQKKHLVLSGGESNSDSPTAVLWLYLSYLMRLVPAGSHHLRKKSKAQILAEGCAAVLTQLLFGKTRKAHREYPLVFSRGFPQYWRNAARENLSGFDSPPLRESTCRYCRKEAYVLWT